MDFRPLLLPLLVLAIALPGALPAWAQVPDTSLRAHAEALAQQNIIVDGHIDVPYRLRRYRENISQEAKGGDFDYPRARAGGLNAAFMSIYTPVEYQETGGAKALADSLIDMVEGFAEQWPDKFAIATSVAEVRRHFEEGLVSLPMGMENGAPVGDDVNNLQHFYDRGIRYITLAHAKVNQLSDSSYDSTRTWQGLSPLGEEVVQEMNRLGMMVDVSHLTDSAFYDVLRVSQAPVLATHSSARHFTPGWERNMSDPMIKDLAAHGGVIMINFGSSFLRQAYQEEGERVQEQIEAHLAANDWDRDDPAAQAYYREQRRAHPIGAAADVADHIDHVVRLVSVDYVGLGSDFDGVFALPAGLQDVSMYPNLIHELLKRGYSDADIRKILGENALRVWTEVERTARTLQQR